METAWDTPAPPHPDDYRHEAFFYKDFDHFLSGALRFIGEATSCQEAVLVVVSGTKIDALSDCLGETSGTVLFADMADVGRNPARIIAAWSEFLRGHANGSRRVHGIGEPIWAERSAEELRECQLHEALLNAAFRGSSFRLLCPYDTSALPHAVLSEALRSHPLMYGEMSSDANPSFPGVDVLDLGLITSTAPRRAADIATVGHHRPPRPERRARVRSCARSGGRPHLGPRR